jgi:hypothetical protein
VVVFVVLYKDWTVCPRYTGLTERSEHYGDKVQTI